MAQGPTIPRRRLRSELRAARDAAGLTQEQVADELSWSTSKIIRIEAGTVGISITDLRALLDMYGFRDARLARELEDLAKMSRKRSWWSVIKDEQVSTQQRMLIGFETEMTTLRHWHPTVVPGLLQTEAYAAALLRDCAIPPPTEASFHTRMDVRLTRQHDTLDRPDPPRVHAIIDESVLHRPVGGDATMRKQLDHLLDLGERDTIDISVLPWRAGAHPGMVYGAFAILQFEQTKDADVAYVDSGPGDRLLSDDKDEIAKYWAIMRRLEDAALTAADSRALIAAVRDALDG